MQDSPTKPEPATPVPAATVILLRDGADGLEVFMVTRHPAMWFSGALVYPGGKLDPSDADRSLFPSCHGGDGLTDAQIALRICGIRETFEETGLLLACEADSGELVDGARGAELSRRYRAMIHAGEVTLGEMVQAEELTLAGDRLVPFAHWITPAAFTRRFDTQFFLAEAPAGQEASHDPVEADGSVWIRPALAIEEAAAGHHALMLVTQVNLAKVGRSRTAGEALAAARASSPVTVEPEIEILDNGIIYRFPEAAGYGATEGFEPKLFNGEL
jgi:8-oxo-dGTP pyrophosphatase MutT (NUDIX family)